MTFIHYHPLTDRLLESPTGSIQDVLIAQNGLFLQRQRTEFTAIVPRLWIAAPGLPGVRALGAADQTFRLHVPRVPVDLVKSMEALGRRPQPFVETLFHLVWDNQQWQLYQPQQQQSGGHVQPLGVEQSDSPYQHAAIEVHTHPEGCDQFSSLDSESATGFRVFALITNLSTRPKWVVRVGNEGHFLPLEPTTIFEGAS